MDRRRKNRRRPRGSGVMSTHDIASLQADIDRMQVAQAHGAGWSCARKVRYKSEADARRMVEKRARNRGVLMRAYQCPECGGWHLTHILDEAKARNKRQLR